MSTTFGLLGSFADIGILLFVILIFRVQGNLIQRVQSRSKIGCRIKKKDTFNDSFLWRLVFLGASPNFEARFPTAHTAARTVPWTQDLQHVTTANRACACEARSALRTVRSAGRKCNIKLFSLAFTFSRKKVVCFLVFDTSRVICLSYQSAPSLAGTSFSRPPRHENGSAQNIIPPVKRDNRLRERHFFLYSVYPLCVLLDQGGFSRKEHASKRELRRHGRWWWRGGFSKFLLHKKYSAVDS